MHHDTPGSGLSARAAFNAGTRGGHRAAGVQDGGRDREQPGAPAHYAIWAADGGGGSPPSSRVQRWSTDPRSGVPSVPRPDAELPPLPADRPRGTDHPRRLHTRCLKSSRPGRRRTRRRDYERAARGRPWLLRLPRGRRLGVLLYLSYPPRSLWWLAPMAFAGCSPCRARRALDGGGTVTASCSASGASSRCSPGCRTSSGTGWAGDMVGLSAAMAGSMVAVRPAEHGGGPTAGRRRCGWRCCSSSARPSGRGIRSADFPGRERVRSARGLVPAAGVARRGAVGRFRRGAHRLRDRRTV